MNSIETCSREERLERALLAIEGLTYLCERIEEDPFSSKVYMIAHAATARCKTRHEDWLKEIENIEELCFKSNIMNVKKILERPLDEIS